MGHEVVNVNAFNTDDPSSNPARLNLCFFLRNTQATRG